MHFVFQYNHQLQTRCVIEILLLKSKLPDTNKREYESPSVQRTEPAEPLESSSCSIVSEINNLKKNVTACVNMIQNYR